MLMACAARPAGTATPDRHAVQRVVSPLRLRTRRCAKPGASSRAGSACSGVGSGSGRAVFTLAVAGGLALGVHDGRAGVRAGPHHAEHGAPGVRGRPRRLGRGRRGGAADHGGALFKAMGIAARRIYAGQVQYDLGAIYRRRVAKRYLELPLRWHQAHPTGRLLSVANSDVEQTWEPMAPYPMAVGVVVMLVVTVAVLIATDPVLAIVGGRDLPADRGLNVLYSRRLAPLMIRAQELRAEVSGQAHESFDGALTVKVLGRGAEETERFAEQGPRAAGCADPGRPAARPLRPGARGAAQPGGAAGAAGGRPAGVLRRSRPRVGWSGSPTSSRCWRFPIRAIGWLLADLPRSIVGWDRMHDVLDASDSLAGGGAGTCPRAWRPPAALSVRGVTFAYPGADPCWTGLDLDVQRRAHGGAGRPDRRRQVDLASLLLHLLEPDRRQHHVDGVDVRELRPRRAGRAQSRSCRSRRSCSTTPCGAMSRSAPSSAPRKQRSRRRRGAAPQPRRRVRRPAAGRRR